MALQSEVAAVQGQALAQCDSRAGPGSSSARRLIRGHLGDEGGCSQARLPLSGCVTLIRPSASLHATSPLHMMTASCPWFPVSGRARLTWGQRLLSYNFTVCHLLVFMACECWRGLGQPCSGHASRFPHWSASRPVRPRPRQGTGRELGGDLSPH